MALGNKNLGRFNLDGSEEKNNKYPYKLIFKATKKLK